MDCEKTYTLPEKALTLFRIRLLCVYILIGILMGVLFCFFPLWALIAGILAVAAGLFLNVFYLPECVKGISIEVSGDRITVKKGVFIRRSYIMPDASLLYKQQRRSIIEAALKLSTVCFRVSRSRVSVPGLTVSDAEEITGGVL